MENRRSGKEQEQFKSVYNHIKEKRVMVVLAMDFKAWKERFTYWMKEHHPEDLELIDNFIK